jgi:hypothetical protein
MASPEILPGWRDGAARTAIVEFVRSAAEAGDSFVPPAYDQGAERAFSEAKRRGWTVVSMKREFATIF